MTSKRRAITAAAAFLLAGGALFWSGSPPTSPGDFVSRAEARVGRPLTPMSYAGVARRTTRRAAAVGAAGAAGAYYYNYRPGCTRAVNAYGQTVYRCP